jgi:hypothetical protein
MTACLVAICKTMEEVRLFGDAFDECSEWNHLWHFLSSLVKSKCSSLRFIFTSRPERNIREAANSLGIPSMDLRCDGIDQDIERLISDSLADDPRLQGISPDGKILVADKLVSGANAMYVFFTVSLYPITHCSQVSLGGSSTGSYLQVPKHALPSPCTFFSSTLLGRDV